MLIEYSFQNFASFNNKQTLSMLASTSTKENFNEENTFLINKLGIERVLKGAAVFGANASGKTNLVNSLGSFQKIILESLKSLSADTLLSAMPFFIKKDWFDKPTEFEVTFFLDGRIYRYGIAISGKVISEEWLYWTKTKRETMLFHRQGQNIEFNKRSFGEASDFVRENNGVLVIEKTKEFIPFISVLSQFDGPVSNQIIKWFQKLNIISGINDQATRGFTTKMLDTNPEFKAWALKFLTSLQIQDLRVIEVDSPPPSLNSETTDSEISEVIERIKNIYSKNQFKEKKIQIIKRNSATGETYTLPLEIESEGTRKLLYLLGPLYDVIKNKELLVIDEFDNKFHSLLSKFILDIYQKNNSSGSQMIITCHDTNLLNKDLFRRDQIWFVEKSEAHESELYSLLEYKEHYARKSDSYSKDYLAGKYGAIPLFNSFEHFSECLNG